MKAKTERFLMLAKGSASQIAEIRANDQKIGLNGSREELAKTSIDKLIDAIFSLREVISQSGIIV